jgi:hypothetical protein
MAIFVAAAFSVGLVTGVNISKPEKQSGQPCAVDNQNPDNGKDPVKKNGEQSPVATPEYPAAPEFAVTNPETGDEMSLETLAGSNALMLIVTTSCPVCREQIDELKRIYKTYSAKEVKFFEAIIPEADESGFRLVDELAAAEHVRDSGLPFPSFIDEMDELAASYNVESVPFLAFITKEGRLMATRPFTYAADVARILDALMAGRAIDTLNMETKAG